jgi:hypothetical protein
MHADAPTSSVAAAATEIERRYGEHLAALLAYGSRVFGQARRGSEYDFWVIVKDPAAFHRDNAEFYRTHLNMKSTPEEQTRLNRSGPLFYAFDADAMTIKMAVIGEATFTELCRDAWWSVKGRMQKPVRPFKMSPAVEQAVADARHEGFTCALALAPKRFTLDDLLFQICSLSYRAEIRPEAKKAKIRSIVESARTELEAIYEPMLAECGVVRREGAAFVDTRSDPERRRARRDTLRALRRSKWSGRSLGWIWRNFRSHGAPVKYLLMKIRGEIEKAFKRLFGHRS